MAVIHTGLKSIAMRGRHSLSSLKRKTTARCKKFPLFPLGAEVSLFGKTPVGKVKEHDWSRGRIVTEDGAYMPEELTVTKMPKEK